MYNLPKNETVDVSRLEAIFNDVTNSYKFYWLKSIVEETILGNKEIEYKTLICRMLANTWYPVTEFYLNLGIQDEQPKHIRKLQDVLNILNTLSKEEIYRTIYNYQNIEDTIKPLTKYVPFRLLTPFFEKEIKGKKDNDKNRLISELAKNTDKAIYVIDEKNRKIILNENWHKYIYDNQVIILGWLDYKIIQYLQKKNPNIPAIPFKLLPPLKRDLTKATKLWKDIIKNNNIIDIYTKKPFTEKNFEIYGNISIDHFVPWSFVLHDEIWNLIPTFKNVNSSKSNKLPDNMLLERFCELQYLVFTLLKKNKNKKHIEDYINIYNKLDIKKFFNEEQKISKEEFYAHLKDTINPLIQIAYNQGYGVWEGCS